MKKLSTALLIIFRIVYIALIITSVALGIIMIAFMTNRSFASFLGYANFISNIFSLANSEITLNDTAITSVYPAIILSIIGLGISVILSLRANRMICRVLKDTSLGNPFSERAASSLLSAGISTLISGIISLITYLIASQMAAIQQGIGSASYHFTAIARAGIICSKSSITLDNPR